MKTIHSLSQIFINLLIVVILNLSNNHVTDFSKGKPLVVVRLPETVTSFL